MIREEEACVVICPTLAQVLEARECCEKKNIDVKLISVPGKVEHGCGTALKADPGSKECIACALKEAGIEVEKIEIVRVEA